MAKELLSNQAFKIYRAILHLRERNKPTTSDRVAEYTGMSIREVMNGVTELIEEENITVVFTELDKEHLQDEVRQLKEDNEKLGAIVRDRDTEIEGLKELLHEVWTEAEVRDILGDWINKEEGGLYNLREYIYWLTTMKKVDIDGRYTAEELRAIAWWIEHKQE